ncbi:MAG TPA: type II secretion system protein [Pseudidiomarina sp.]|nr:type II secretion system protein [Pseudidiomarina sp.]
MIPRGRGFTLIELLVVLAIVGIALSLIGPVGINQYERMQVTEDREKFLRQLDAIEFNAFTLDAQVLVELKGQQVQVRSAEQLLQAETFEHIEFPNQTFTVNTHGFWTPSEVRWLEAGQARRANLNPARIQGVIDGD